MYNYRYNELDGSSNRYYYEKNLMGDIIGIYDESGSKVAGYIYDAWGNCTVQTYGNDARIGEVNPFRYRGYYYDDDLGLYYLKSRYYDAQVARFLNADGIEYLGANGDLAAYNLFAYCSNNPVNMFDSFGNWPKLSTVFTVVFILAAVVATVAMAVAACGATSTALAVAGGGAVGVIPATVTVAATSVAKDAAVVAVVSAVAAAICENEENKRERSYSVYFLQDEEGIVQYVGRVTDEGYNARMKHHFATKGLTPAHRISGLSYEQARGGEEIGMLLCHTLKAGHEANNKIHGISTSNSKRLEYMEAAWDYLFNHIEDWMLNIFE